MQNVPTSTNVQIAVALDIHLKPARVTEPHNLLKLEKIRLPTPLRLDRLKSILKDYPFIYTNF